MVNPAAFSYVTTEDGKESEGVSPGRRLTLVPGGWASESGEIGGGRVALGGASRESQGAARGRGRGRRLTLTRRAGWFELNPGCFGRAALAVAAAAGIGGTAVVVGWRLRAPLAAAKAAHKLWRWVRG